MLPRIIAALAGALMLAACNPAAQIETAEERITAFHADYNEGDIDALYAAGSEAFRESTSREQMEGLAALFATRLGKVVSTERTGFNTSYDNGVNTTIIDMQTRFEKGEGKEVFIFTGSGDEMRLHNWNVTSEALRGPTEDGA